MERNASDGNQLDGDALLPPRKRLLAGLKRQNLDINFHPSSAPCNAGNEYDAPFDYLLRSNLGNRNLSNEEIVEASRLAAIEAMKAAEAARAIAEEKAAKAAKAVCAAKTALELIASFSEETTASREKYLEKNKKKKHLPVQTLYNKHKGITNCRTDEELAQKLHLAINSSPRISKNFSSSDLKNHKHKRLKSSASGRTSTGYGGSVWEEIRSSRTIGNVVTQIDTEGCRKEVDLILINLNTSKFNNVDQPKLENGEGSHHNKPEWLKLENGVPETHYSKKKTSESLDSFGKKRGRIKQKRLPLSICSFRDLTSPKEELKPRGMSGTEENTDTAATGY